MEINTDFITTRTLIDPSGNECEESLQWCRVQDDDPRGQSFKDREGKYIYHTALNAQGVDVPMKEGEPDQSDPNYWGFYKLPLREGWKLKSTKSVTKK